MQPHEAIAALASLAQEHRLAAFRELVAAGPDGRSAGELADRLQIPASSLSFHLVQLARSGLVSSERRSRHIIYRADFSTMNALLAYLLDNCCSGTACEVEIQTLRSACK